MKKWIALLLVACVLLAGCGGQAAGTGLDADAGSRDAAPADAGSSLPPDVGGERALAPAQGTDDGSGTEADTGARPCYFEQLAADAVAQMALTGQETDSEVIRAAYLHVIRRTTYIEFDQPELTESWRYRDGCGKAPSVYQTAALGPLAYGIGTCENFSAALVVLLQQLGFEALYLTGLTYSYDNRLVDHAWVMVKMGEAWYHIDPQLEDNVIRGGVIQYRYFLKGDEEFAAHHIWGAALPYPDEHALALPACPQTAPVPEAEAIEQWPAPDVDGLIARAKKEVEWATRPPVRLEPAGELPLLPRYLRAAAEGTPMPE